MNLGCRLDLGTRHDHRVRKMSARAALAAMLAWAVSSVPGALVHADTSAPAASGSTALYTATADNPSGAVCSSIGDTTEPSILALRFDAASAAALPLATQQFLSSIHPGARCTWTSMQLRANPATIASNPPYPDGYGFSDAGLYYGTDNYVLHDCGQTTTQTSCVAEFNQLIGSFGIFSDGFYYNSGQSLDCQFPNCTPSDQWGWSNTQINYSNSDNEAVSYGVATSYGSGAPANNTAQQWVYWASNGTGEHDKGKECIFAPGVCLVVLVNYSIHVGQAGTLSNSSSGASGFYCTLADFKPYQNQITFSTGDCQAP